jgi:hypothetical protein
MTIRQLKASCFVLDPNPRGRDEGLAHYDMRETAEAALAGERDDAGGDEDALARLDGIGIRQLDGSCWVAECDAPDGPDGCCGDTLGDEDEGPSCVHFEALDGLLEWMPGEGWVRVGADGALCGRHAELGGWPVLPPRVPPAEQEAAGQLVIPGVLAS